MSRRPSGWRTVGQNSVVELLQRGLRQGRVSHAYLLVGPQHVGKMTLALDLARGVNCDSDTPPCGECRSCLRIADGKHADVRVLSLDAVTLTETAKGKRRTELGIDDIKDVQGLAALPPFEGKTKVFIVDGAERLSTEAANCLLKTLEEPPPHVLFILLSAHENLVLPTVISRCQRLELRPLSTNATRQLLMDRYGMAETRAGLLARVSSGCLGWAVTAMAGEDHLEHRSKSLNTLMEITSTDYAERLGLAQEWAGRFEKSREDIESLLSLWLGWWRDLMLVKSGCPAGVTNVDYQAELERQAGLFPTQEVARLASVVRQTMERMALNANPRLALEFLMLSIPKKGRATPATVAPTG